MGVWLLAGGHGVCSGLGGWSQRACHTPPLASPGHTMWRQQTDRWRDGWTGMESLGVGGWGAGSQSGNVLRSRGRGRMG